MLIRPTSSWMPFLSTPVRIRDSVNFSVTARSAGGAPIVGRNPSAGRNAHGALSGSTPAPKPRGAATDVPAAVPEPGSASRTVSPYTAWPLASISLQNGSIEIPRYHIAPLKHTGYKPGSQYPRHCFCTKPGQQPLWKEDTCTVLGQFNPRLHLSVGHPRQKKAGPTPQSGNQPGSLSNLPDCDRNLSQV